MFKSVKNEIINTETGAQIAIVLATNCTKREAAMMAAFAAQQMNYELRNKLLKLVEKK